MRLRPSDRVDRYTLVELLGEGGQGSVWKACDPLHGNAFRALKLVALDPGDSTSFERARREATILAHIRHPALVRCHGLFEDLHSSTVGIVLDFVEGVSLEKGQLDSRMRIELKFMLLMQLLQALAHLHAQGIAHRDLKPSNILVTKRFWQSPDTLGTVQLVDFGIAAPRANPKPITAEGGFIGTIRYLAPEIIDPAVWGKYQEHFNRDIFAFGIIAWELLFGEHPTRLRHDASMVDYCRAYSAAKNGLLRFPPLDIEPQWGPWGQVMRSALRLRVQERPASGEALLKIVQTGMDPLAQVTRNSEIPPSVKKVIVTEPMAHSPIPPASITAPPLVKAGSPTQLAHGHTNTPSPQVQGPASPPPSKGSLWGSLMGWLLGFSTLAILSYVVMLNFDAIEKQIRDTLSPSPDPGPPVQTVTPSPPPVVPAPINTSKKLPTPSIKPLEPPRECSLPVCGNASSPVCTKKSSSSDCNICPPQAQRSCLPHACDQPIPRDAFWNLRLASAFVWSDFVGNEEVIKKYPNAELCIYKEGSAVKPVCQNIAKGASYARAKPLIKVQTSDLIDGKLQVIIRNGHSTLLNWTSTQRVEGNLYATALCVGLKLHLPPKHSLTFFLDDPSP